MVTGDQHVWEPEARVTIGDMSSSNRFVFATGIECSAPLASDGKGARVRRDMLAECGHYERFAEDINLAAELGATALRYGLPYHRVSLGPDRYDWDFADAAMAAVKASGLKPILDLCHFGMPDWTGDFQNPDWPKLFATYCGAVARRYPWVRWFTPVNEIFVCANYSARVGIWNEQLRSDHAFVTALKHLAKAALLACEEIIRHRPDAIFVSSETAEYMMDLAPSPRSSVKFENRIRYASLDLLYGKQPEAILFEYLLDGGLTRDEFWWFMRAKRPGHHILGVDYYGRNERLHLPDGSVTSGEDVLGWYLITQRYYRRYAKPLMHTETNVFDPEAAPNWLWKQWAQVLRMRRDGVPVLGFTWYSLIDQIDWDIGLAEKRGRVNGCGLFDLDRQARPVAAAYRSLIDAFRDTALVPHGELFALTDAPANSDDEV